MKEKDILREYDKETKFRSGRLSGEPRIGGVWQVKMWGQACRQETARCLGNGEKASVAGQHNFTLVK